MEGIIWPHWLGWPDISENLGSTVFTSVTPVVMSLRVIDVCKYLPFFSYILNCFLEQCDQESQAKRNLKKQPTNWASHQRFFLCLCGPYCPCNRTTLHRTLSLRPPFAPHSTDGATLLTAQNFPPKQCDCPPCLSLGCHHSQVTNHLSFGQLCAITCTWNFLSAPCKLTRGMWIII